ncbi:MAG: SET domain-containing protein [Planctomycetota bacterium]|jgi:SET domain-containing protein
MPKSPTLKKKTVKKPATKKPTAKKFPKFENEGVEVKDSNIHGLGLFAVKSFRKGDVIGYYKGPEVTADQDGDHVLWIYDEDEKREYGIDGQNETRFVNHSQKPTAYFNGEELQAMKAIRKGDEVTHNYGEAWADL